MELSTYESKHPKPHMDEIPIALLVPTECIRGDSSQLLVIPRWRKEINQRPKPS